MHVIIYLQNTEPKKILYSIEKILISEKDCQQRPDITLPDSNDRSSKSQFSKCWDRCDGQPGILYPVKVSVKGEGGNRLFQINKRRAFIINRRAEATTSVYTLRSRKPNVGGGMDCGKKWEKEIGKYGGEPKCTNYRLKKTSVFEAVKPHGNKYCHRVIRIKAF